VDETADHALIDLGGGALLERFGERIVDRPHPAALGARSDPAAWRSADLRFDRERGWTGPAANEGPWTVEVGPVRLELRTTEAGQVGYFPEHASMLPWLTRQRPGAVLHLFAYTGLVTLALAATGSEVTHLDASRPSVAWARRNADLSGLADRPIRWIVDDARAFVDREVRRGRRYDGIVLDPPSYGHGTDRRAWRLEEDLPDLLAACRSLLAPDGFVLLTAHTPGFEAGRLAHTLSGGLAAPVGRIESGGLVLTTSDGRSLELGSFARVPGGA